MRLIDITGERFGRLTVIEKHPAAAVSGGSLWLCRCDCGIQKIINSSSLRGRNPTRSCGCLGREVWSAWAKSTTFAEARVRGATKHGHKTRAGMSPEYKTWLQMKRRCTDAKCKDFANWGGRGIKVCERWGSFEAFFADMGPRPFRTASIDRLNPNGNYEPGNCRWVSPEVQAAENRRTLIPVTVGGVEYASIEAACRATGVSKSVAHMRIREGYDLVTAVTVPSHGLPNKRTRESYLRKDRR